ncbi:hypothetical protein NDU88_003048 [Pleurodeles waltl]|uniref:Uncharacterized protein n=1 Tax=Pleurodeles waltl TaxID=8319 RepID=A0AAV7PBT6_PLEWA|nr:hypothetical protein NDU88_003048 [Pleurodeles waltl]
MSQGTRLEGPSTAVGGEKLNTKSGGPSLFRHRHSPNSESHHHCQSGPESSPHLQLRATCAPLLSRPRALEVPTANPYRCLGGEDSRPGTAPLCFWPVSGPALPRMALSVNEARSAPARSAPCPVSSTKPARLTDPLLQERPVINFSLDSKRGVDNEFTDKDDAPRGEGETGGGARSTLRARVSRLPSMCIRSWRRHLG